MPVHVQLAKLRIQLDSPTWRWLYVPTAFWLSAKDWVLQLVPAVGMIAAGAVILGWPSGWSPALLLVAQTCLLSLDCVFWMGFPWDCLLFELGWVAILLPALPPVWSATSLAAAAAPHPLVGWMLRWLLWRLMFGFGKLKFSGTDHVKDRLYVRDFMIMQPIPTWLGWLAHVHLPPWFHQILLCGMFLVEIPLPFLVFVPGWPRVLAAVGLAALQVGIQLHGNFGW